MSSSNLQPPQIQHRLSMDTGPDYSAELSDAMLLQAIEESQKTFAQEESRRVQSRNSMIDGTIGRRSKISCI